MKINFNSCHHLFNSVSLLFILLCLLLCQILTQCFGRTNYTDQILIKVPHHELQLHQTGINKDKLPLPQDQGEVLWLGHENNMTWAYIRVRNKRHIPDWMVMSNSKIITSDLESWMMATAPRHNEFDSSYHESVLVKSFHLDKYHPLNEIYEYLNEIDKLNRVKVIDVGYSHEGRMIKGIEIRNSLNNHDYIWIDACTHAREWITVSTAMFIIEKIILSGIKKNFIIVPVINVDGYEYTWTTDRMWRKNRRIYQKSSKLTVEMPDRCNGVDLNRNWDINFGGEGSSLNPCSYLYAGPGPFSEPETRAVGDLIWTLRNQIKLFISLHSFNQLWACPYAYTKFPSKHVRHHLDVLKDIQNAVFNEDGVKYRFGPLSSSLYVGSGFAMDWVYDKLGIVNSYLVELRDKGEYGFLLPSHQIIPTASETWKGIQVAINKIFK